MKTKKNLLIQVMVVASFLFVGAFALNSCSKNDENKTPPNKTYTISGNATGNQLVPSVADSGSAAISGTYASGTRQLITSTTWTNLTGRPVGGGFYTGATGTNGSLVGNGWTFDTTLTANGMRADTLTLTAAQDSQLVAGNWYYVLSTTANPNGEVRGQITATPQ